MASHEPVPHYALYGEHSLTAQTGAVHCETIAARSRIYRWEIATHRHADLWQAIFLASGTADVRLDGFSAAGQGPLLVIAPARVAHGFRFSEGAEGLVLTVTDDFMLRFADDDPLPLRMAQAAIWDLDDAARSGLLALGDHLLDAIAQAGAREHHLLQAALAESWLRSAMAPIAHPVMDNQDGRLRAFKSLVERHYRDHHPLAFYAGRLNCTERTLARLTRSAWGLSPAEVIHRRIMLEARRLLRFTNASSAMVADELGFADPSYFSRFYRRMAGRRPSEERGRKAAGDFTSSANDAR